MFGIEHFIYELALLTYGTLPPPRSAVSTCTRASKEEDTARAQAYIGECVRGFPGVAGATRVQRTF